MVLELQAGLEPAALPVGPGRSVHRSFWSRGCGGRGRTSVLRVRAACPATRRPRIWFSNRQATAGCPFRWTMAPRTLGMAGPRGFAPRSSGLEPEMLLLHHGPVEGSVEIEHRGGGSPTSTGLQQMRGGLGWGSPDRTEFSRVTTERLDPQDQSPCGASWMTRTSCGGPPRSRTGLSRLRGGCICRSANGPWSGMRESNARDPRPERGCRPLTQSPTLGMVLPRGLEPRSRRS